ncbi:MAG: hypothetical protein WD357_07025 [Gracilimonas sp.]
MREIILVIIVSVLFGCAAIAQEAGFAGNLQLVYPQGEYKESLDRLGYGLNFNGYYRTESSPMGFGFDINFMNFGVDSREEPISSNIPDVRVEVTNSYNLFQFLLLGKLQPVDGALRPYAEGLAGVNYFYTSTTINERNNSSSDPIASDTNFKDFAFGYGGGAGTMIRVFDKSGRPPKYNEEGSEMVSPKAGYINLGVRYLFGSEAEYLREGSIQVNNGSVTYDTFRSRTNMMIIQLGFVIRY